MVTVAQPTVEVVTAGTDWAAIVAAIVTGLAAIVGIVGTSWQASRARQAATADLKTSIDATAAAQQSNIEAAAKNLLASSRAEAIQALRSEKMRLYSEFQGAVDTALVIGGDRNSSEDVAAVYRSAAAVTLVANEGIRTLVRYLSEEIIRGRNQVSSSGSAPPIFRSKREELYELMRTDLDIT